MNIWAGASSSVVERLVANEKVAGSIPVSRSRSLTRLIIAMIFWGKVRKRSGRGKTLGFPTANVNLRKPISQGIYISQTRVGKNLYHSVTFIGQAKTFNETKFQAESYIFNFNKSIYGQWISMYLIKKIRNNKKFTSKEDLVKEIKKDITKAKAYFSRL